MSFTIKLYKSNAEKERVNKSNFLSNEISLTGVLRESTSAFAPIIRIEETNNISQYNYAYINIFGRYYYIDDIISIVNNIWEIHLSCDVLMTYKDDILKTSAIISKQESNPINKYYNDGTYKNEERTCHKVIEFDDLFELGFDYIVTTIGGFPINQPV